MLARPTISGERAAARAARTRHVSHKGLTWIDIVNPGTEEIAFLRQHYPFHPLNLDDCLSRVQRPKLDIYPDDNYLFLVVHLPVFDRTRRAAVAGEVDVFLGSNYLITVHQGQLKPLSRMFNVLSVDEAAREQVMSRGSGYLLYRMLDALVKQCFPMLFQVDKNLEEIDEMMFGANVPSVVQEISLVRRDIIALRRILRPNMTVIQQLEDQDFTFLDFDEQSYFGDVTDSLARLWDMLEEQNELIISFTATLDSLTSHRINEIMKILTLISVVLLPMTLVASIYGMNVDLPLDDLPFAFGIPILLMLISAVGMLLYFRYKKWV